METLNKKEIKNIIKEILKKEHNCIYLKTALCKNLKGNLLYLDGKNDYRINEACAKQFLEISRSLKLLRIMDVLSYNVSYNTSITINKYCEYLITALDVYEQGKDTPKFDKDVKELNDFISSHIVKVKVPLDVVPFIKVKHKTFREATKKEIAKNSLAATKNSDKFAQIYNEMPKLENTK